MFSALAAPVAGFLTKNKLLSALIGVMALVIAIGGSYFLGSYNGEKRADIENAALMQKAVNEALKRNTAALERAATQRRIDDASVASTKRGREDAVATFPDARPTDRGIAITCDRLRDEGHNINTYPECVRLGRPAEAPDAR